MKTILMLTIFTSLFCFGQLKDSTKWEYMILEVDQVSYINLFTDSAFAILVKQSTGLIGKSESESITTERMLDAQGRDGWELVGVLGAVGAPREYTFKRKVKPGTIKVGAK